MYHRVFVWSLHLWLLSTSIMVVGVTINVGTSLYGRRDLTKTWTKLDVIRLRSRMMVDQLLPSRIPDAAAFVKYLKLMANKSEIIDSDVVRRQTMVVVADAVGGYMHGLLLPRVTSDYYEGHVDYDVTNELHGTMRKIKFVLDTDGRGWKEPEEEAQHTRHVEDDEDEDRYRGEDACAGLLTERSSDERDEVVVPVPEFDDDLRPGSVAVPFASGKRLFAVDEPAGTPDGPPLSRYYRLAAACTSASPFRFRRDVRLWLDAAVTPLLARPHRWYPALSGARRVVRAAARAHPIKARGVVGRPKREFWYGSRPYPYRNSRLRYAVRAISDVLLFLAVSLLYLMFVSCVCCFCCFCCIAFAAAGS